jgi:hypothetical protein
MRAMTVNSIVGVETMATVYADMHKGTIEGDFPPGDREALIAALLTVVEELRSEPGVPAYVEYDEGKIHAGLNLIMDCDDQCDDNGRLIKLDSADDFDSIDEASWSDVEGDAEYASWYDGMTDNELAS